MLSTTAASSISVLLRTSFADVRLPFAFVTCARRRGAAFGCGSGSLLAALKPDRLKFRLMTRYKILVIQAMPPSGGDQVSLLGARSWSTTTKLPK